MIPSGRVQCKFYCVPKMSFHVRLVGLVVVLILGIQQQQEYRVQAYQDAFTSTELSYFFGRKPDADFICFEKQLIKGTTLPTTVTTTQAVSVLCKISSTLCFPKQLYALEL